MNEDYYGLSQEVLDNLKLLVYDILMEDPIDYMGLDIEPEEFMDRALIGVLPMVQDILDRPSHEQITLITATLTKLVMENMIMWTKIKLENAKS